jgi:hypothetical protein
MTGPSFETQFFVNGLEQSADMRRDPAAISQRVEFVELMLERAFTLPGTNRRVGLDAIIGLIPVVGDLLAAALGAWIVWEARNLGMSRWQIARMSANIGVDTALGAIPFVGDLFDLAFRSNSRNLRIIRKHLDKHHPGTRRPETITIDA